jgi:hypothetical protein
VAALWYAVAALVMLILMREDLTDGRMPLFCLGSRDGL